jgi:hypothetical protein
MWHVGVEWSRSCLLAGEASQGAWCPVTVAITIILILAVLLCSLLHHLAFLIFQLTYKYCLF